MSLTRKKYCQSTKVYYSIFNSEFEFEALQCQIKTMRKHIHLVAFQLFLQNVPSEKLPNELWEKIWKQTLAQVRTNFIFIGILYHSDITKYFKFAAGSRLSSNTFKWCKRKSISEMDAFRKRKNH